MAGDFINDAKTIVEQAWNWSQLRSTLTVPTVASTTTYSLTGFGDTATLLGATNDTSNAVLEYRPRAWLEEQIYVRGATTGSPSFYTFAGVDGSSDAQVQVYPTPDAVYSLRFDTTLRQDALSVGTDVLLVPHMPVLHLALALLARERGENQGSTAQEYFAVAEQYLQDAIAYDAARHPEETVWYS
tara:strand:+ start:310 stop:867 length:558 start_codon:yes stop_codon:yes gene_type:complete